MQLVLAHFHNTSGEMCADTFSVPGSVSFLLSSAARAARIGKRPGGRLKRSESWDWEDRTVTLAAYRKFLLLEGSRLGLGSQYRLNMFFTLKGANRCLECAPVYQALKTVPGYFLRIITPSPAHLW